MGGWIVGIGIALVVFCFLLAVVVIGGVLALVISLRRAVAAANFILEELRKIQKETGANLDRLGAKVDSLQQELVSSAGLFKEIRGFVDGLGKVAEMQVKVIESLRAETAELKADIKDFRAALFNFVPGRRAAARTVSTPTDADMAEQEKAAREALPGEQVPGL